MRALNRTESARASGTILMSYPAGTLVRLTTVATLISSTYYPNICVIWWTEHLLLFQKLLDVTVAEHGANDFNKIKKETHEYI